MSGANRTETLTNKSIDGANNTITGIGPYTYFIYKIGSTYFSRTGADTTSAVSSNADFKTLIQAIINGISPAGTPTMIQLGAGDFNVASQILIPKTAVGNITIRGMGAGVTNLVITSAWNGTTVGNTAIQFGEFQTIAAGVTGTLTANVAKNSGTVTMSTTDSAKFAVADYVMLTSTALWSSAPNTITQKSEIKRVTGVNTGTGVITFDVPTYDAYTTATTAVLYKLSNFISNITLSGVSIKKASGLTAANGVVFFEARCIDNLIIEEVEAVDPVTNFGGCLNVRSCLNSKVTKALIRMTATATFNSQYGLVVGNCSQSVAISNSHSYGKFEHAFEAGSSDNSTNGRGVGRNISFFNCFAEGAGEAAFDTHGDAELVTFNTCDVLGTSQNTGVNGFQIRSRNSKFINCNAKSTKSKGFYIAGDAHDCEIIDCTAIDCQSNGLSLASDYLGVKRTRIIGGTFSGNGNLGISIGAACNNTTIDSVNILSNADRGIYIIDSNRMNITNCTINSNAFAGIQLDATATQDNNLISHNNLESNGGVGALEINASVNWIGINNIGYSNTGLVNQNINATSNTITDTSTALGDILMSNGTKFLRMARGSTNQVLQSTATTLQWATFNAENTGIAIASGNGSTTVFNIAHSIGSTPTVYMASLISLSPVTYPFTYTADATNIVVTFTTAPVSGTNNVKISWRAVA
jgi:parallel beta-helix repeat protein